MSGLTARRVRVCLGALWLLDAALQSQPQFFTADWWHDDLAESVMGQPAPVSRSILWATGVLAPHAVVVNTIVVAVQATFGLCLLAGRFERAAIAASVPYSLMVWWVGEGFGALPTGFAVLPGGAPGAAVLYPLIGLICWPRRGAPTNRGGPAIEVRRAVWCWVALWFGGTLTGLPWRFPASTTLRANIEQSSLGQPGWLRDLSHGAYHAVGSHPLLLPAVLVAAQVAVGLGVLADRTRHFALVAGVALTLLFWVTVQGLGGIAAGGATDPGSAPLIVLLAAAIAFSRNVQMRRDTEYKAWSSTSRTTRRVPIASAGTT